VRASVAQAVKEAAARGSVPAGLKRWAESWGRPRANWQSLLRSSIRAAVIGGSGAKSHYTYMRPSRRQSAVPDVVLPGFVSMRTSAAVIIDTSGSMSGVDLGRALSEVSGVLNALGTAVDVYAGDAELASTVRQARSVSQVEAALTGGGGTDMGRIISEVDSKRRYDVIVCLTDGETGWPGRQTRANVIVGLVRADSSVIIENIPKWIRVVHCGD